MGDPVAATWDATMKTYALLDSSISIDQFFTFDLTSPRNVQGCYYQISKSTGTWSRCYMMTGERISQSTGFVFSETAEPAQKDEQMQYYAEWAVIDESSLIESWSSMALTNNLYTSFWSSESFD